MQDRLKFRCFNKYANKMVEPKNWQNVEGIYKCIKQQVCFDEDIPPIPYDHIGRNGLVFMQCTDLKDKNGKLIYEGDIVKISPSGFFDNDRDVFYIKFTDGYRLAYQDWQTLDTIGGFSNKLFEIIGNIYETPELLKDGE